MRSTSETTPIPAEDFASALPERFLRCRELGHIWRPHTAVYDRKERVYDRVLRCSSCRTERHQILNQYGHVLSNSYRYPDHYLAGHGVQRGTYNRDVFRLEALVRFIDNEGRKAV